MDTLLDNLIFLIPVAIFIGRIVVMAKSKDKKKTAPKWPDTRPARQEPSEPEISIHFEDDPDDEIPETMPGPAAPLPRPARLVPEMPSLARPAMIPPLVPAPATKTYAAYTPAASDFAGIPAKSQGARAQAAKSAATAERAPFSFNLDNLSPLKQAVVMAEILGPPKGLS